MVGHLLLRLHDAETQQQHEQQQQQQRYAVCVTGDHSTPVVFGDHSHEPVPLAVARVSEAVAAMGGPEQVQLRRKHMIGDAEQQQQVGWIPLPNMKQPPALQELLQQAAQQRRRREAAARGDAWCGDVQQQGVVQPAAAGAAATAGADSIGRWPEAWPQRQRLREASDGVCAFDELSAARGSLGRFTGAGVMPLLKQFGGWRV
jgi:hypothetical protein